MLARTKSLPESLNIPERRGSFWNHFLLVASVRPDVDVSSTSLHKLNAVNLHSCSILLILLNSTLSFVIYELKKNILSEHPVYYREANKSITTEFTTWKIFIV